MYRVNLLPPKLQREGTIDVRRLFLLAGITVLLAGFVGLCVFFPLNYFLMKNELELTRQQIAELEPVVNRVQALRKERQDLEKAVAEYRTIFRERKTWSSFISGLDSITPVDLWLMGLEISHRQEPGERGEGGTAGGGAGSRPAGSPDRPNMVVFKGVSRTLSSVGVFEQHLHQLGVFERLELKKISAGDNGLNFEITGYLREVCSSYQQANKY
ncbi:PilN domain-containing protein [Desulfofundulus australicus]|nr:hypothetical protein [Desulfofundulus australicus]